MKSTKIKTKKEIAKTRQLRKDGMSMKSISKKMGFSVNTIKKIVHQTNGYESDIFDRGNRWRGRQHYAPIYISQIDGEKIHYQKPTSADYPRISTTKGRMWLHIYEAKKVFRILNTRWPEKAIVHHIDYNKENLSSCNIVVFDGTGLHIQHHNTLEKAMYGFLYQKKLLNEFYENYPKVKCETLKDLLKKHKIIE